MITNGHKLRVLLINAPFGLIEFPNLGTSLVKAATVEAGFECDVLYATVEFASRIGFAQYLNIERADCPLLLPERPFARALAEGVRSVDEYYTDLVEPFTDGLWVFLNSRNGSGNQHENMRRLEEVAIQFADEVANRAEMANYDVFGFTSSFGQQTASLAIAKRLKSRFPDKIIAFGGANCEGRMGQQLTASFPFVDYAFSGDGDMTFPVFLQQLQQGHSPKIHGVFSKHSPKNENENRNGEFTPLMRQKMDELPFPDFSDFFDAHARAPEGHGFMLGIPIEGSRGCWWGEKHHCTFCGLNGLTMTYRSKSPARFCDELEYLVDKYGHKDVMATDNILDFRYLKTLVPILKERRKHDVLFFEVKANLTKEQLIDLASVGISHLQPGIESLSTRILKLMDKGTTALQNVQLLKNAEEIGITLVWNVICGFPGESAEDYSDIADLMQKIPHLQPPKAFCRLSIDRFSPYFNQPEKYGIRIAPSPAYAYVYDLHEDEIKNLAYWYYYECENGNSRYSLAPPEFARRAAKVRMIWESNFGKVKCSYSLDHQGLVTIEDTRPGAKHRQLQLNSLESAIFRLSDQITSQARVEEGLRKIMPDSPVASDKVSQIRAKFEDLSILHCEGDRFLALPIDDSHRIDFRTVGESSVFPL